MAHQTHALPWNTIASLFKYKFNPRLDPKFNDIVFLQKGTEPKEIDHFCRAFAKQLHEFAATERAKFPPSDAYRRRAEAWVTEAAAGTPAGTTTTVRPVYPDAIHQRYFGPQDGSDDDRFRRMWGRDWLNRVEHWTGDIYSSRIRYADTLKIMMLEAAAASPALTASPSTADAESQQLRAELMESLLLLTNHPEIRAHFDYLVTEPYGDYGLSRVVENGVRSYVYANVLAALQDRGDTDIDAAVRDVNDRVRDPGHRCYMDLPSYRGLLRTVAGSYDGDTQNLPHWDFYLRRTATGWDDEQLKDVLADRAALVDYLKSTWRVLVIYVVVLREAGREPDIERYCKSALNDSFDLDLNMYTTSTD